MNPSESNEPLSDSPRTYECHITFRLPTGGSITIDATDLTPDGVRELWQVLGPAFADLPGGSASDEQ